MFRSRAGPAHAAGRGCCGDALQPLALLWLLLAMPAILLLYLLKLKRREHSSRRFSSGTGW